MIRAIPTEPSRRPVPELACLGGATSSRDRAESCLTKEGNGQYVQLNAKAGKAMKKRIISVLAVAGTVLTTAGLPAQQPGERRVLDAASRALAVESVASVVEQNYPWPDTARMIAAHVREQHISDAYDAFSTLAELANALTRDLRAINGDVHLGVRDGPPGGPGMMTPGSAGPRTGVERVERLDGNVGYLKLNMFIGGDAAFDAVAQALDSLDGTDAMVLDLRAVPGGNAEMANFIVSHFLPPDVLSLYAVSQATGDTTSHVTLSEVPGPRLLDVPLYVLVNGGSASAAEHVPFVLQNFERATIVGERTPGAGRNNVWFPAELGLSVSLSTTRVHDPLSGRGWERTGVLPDIVTTSEEALTTALTHARETIGRPPVPITVSPATRSQSRGFRGVVIPSEARNL
jgi:retinol-binding protein 3